jgi:hypothetical protein
VTSSAVSATVDAAFDWKINGKRATFMDKGVGTSINDFMWGTTGTAGGMAFGKNPLIMEITGTAVTTVPTVMLNTVTNSVINE